MVEYIIQKVEETLEVTPTPTTYPDNLEYHYLTNYFTGDMELWSILNVVITLGLAILILFLILYIRYRCNKK